MMFYFNKKLHDFDKSVREDRWDQLRIIDRKIITINSELFNKNILILGFGRIGKELSKRCKAFGMQVFVYDPYIDNQVIEDYKLKKINTLDEGVALADYLSIHIPLSSETKNLIDNKILGKMKKNAFIINTARGGIINENDLNEALSDDVIAGAGIDVFSEEPPNADNPLLKNPKVVLTPHTAALTKECWLRMGQETITNIMDFFDNNLNEKVIVNRNSI